MLANANFFTIFTFDVDASCLLAGGADQHNVGDMDGSLNGSNATFRVCLSRAHCLLHHVDLFNGDALSRGVGSDYDAFSTLILTSKNLDLVTLFDVHLCHGCSSYSVSGARDTIFMYFLSRSSRATGPKIRVPRGAPLLSIRTQAFWSNLM